MSASKLSSLDGTCRGQAASKILDSSLGMQSPPFMLGDELGCVVPERSRVRGAAFESAQPPSAHCHGASCEQGDRKRRRFEADKRFRGMRGVDLANLACLGV